MIVLMLLALSMILSYLLPVSSPCKPSTEKPYSNSVFNKIQGTVFHYRMFPSTSFPVKGKILFVHGFSRSSTAWEQTAKRISEYGYISVLVDLPGAGNSERKLDYDHSQANRSSDLWLLLNEIDKGLSANYMHMPWHLVGHSMGGGTVAAMAIQHTDRTESLVIVGGALFDFNIIRLLLHFPPFERLAQIIFERVYNSKRIMRMFLQSAYARIPNEEQVNGYIKLLTVPGTAKASVRILKTTKNISAKSLSSLKTPTFLIWGVQDTWVPICKTNRLKDIFHSHTLLRIERAGHCPMETHNDVFIGALQKWLKANDGHPPSETGNKVMELCKDSKSI